MIEAIVACPVSVWNPLLILTAAGAILKLATEAPHLFLRTAFAGIGAFWLGLAVLSFFIFAKCT